MEAIMKAFERMEKAELRKQENRDRQTRRRESDPQQPNCDSKDQLNDEDDSADRSSVKRRRRLVVFINIKILITIVYCMSFLKISEKRGGQDPPVTIIRPAETETD